MRSLFFTCQQTERKALMQTQRPIAALIYDFDNTLCTKDMQEYGFIPSIGMSAEAFWKEVNDLTDREEMDNILAYMFLMVQKGREGKRTITRETFRELGQGIEYFPGVEGWFERINRYGSTLGLQVEHYIVSSGIKEIIEGSTIARHFARIYACEFMYGADGAIRWPKFAVNYTAKTQFLFRINKGVLDIDSKSSERLNRFTPETERRVPFQNMIYFGDGLTDVPCMKLIKSHSGQSIAVYAPDRQSSNAKRLLEENRVNFIRLADYREGSALEDLTKTILRKISAQTGLLSCPPDMD